MIFKGKYHVTSPFGYRTLNGVRDYHRGIDVVGVDSKDIRAVCGGKVTSSLIITDRSNKTWEWGNYVCILGDDGLYYFYCHMSKRCVSRGQTVDVGDKLGEMGYTGYCYPEGPLGAHTHFEVRRSDGTSIDPAPFLGIPNKVGEYCGEETKTEEEMDGTKFKELWNEMREELRDNDAGQWSKEAREWAVNTGLIMGNSVGVNNEPNYMWADLLTREQLVTVLYRFAKMIGKA